MKRREVDPAIAAIVDGVRMPELSAGGEGQRDAGGPGGGRKTKRTPHEAGRAARRVGVTFAWGVGGEAGLDLAERWGCRPGDVMVYGVSHLLAGVEGGEVGRPAGEVSWWQRAGEGFRLPWEPG